jgi:uncharacterized linocin/CFP29 family protein
LSHLLRSHAPITTEGWKRIDDEAKERLVPSLGARRLVDFLGPFGWRYSAVNLGRVATVKQRAQAETRATLRLLQPLVELQAPFQLSREELRAGDRGADDIDFGPLDDAAQRLAEAENSAVFHGWEAAEIKGTIEASPYNELPPGKGPEMFLNLVGAGVERLLENGIAGPYGLALGHKLWSETLEESEQGGYPLLQHLKEITQGPTVWAPGLTEAVLVSLRGGDFLFDCGEDISVGYAHHDADSVSLYLEETFTFRVATPEAAISLGPLAP